MRQTTNNRRDAMTLTIIDNFTQRIIDKIEADTQEQAVALASEKHGTNDMTFTSHDVGDVGDTVDLSSW
jgi:hypothetical protein